MATDTSRHPLRPDRPVTVGSFLLVLVVVAVLFSATFSAYMTAETAYRIDVESTGYALHDGGDTLTVEFRLSNPGGHPIRVDSTPSASTLNVYTSDARYSAVGGTAVDGATLPADGQATVTATFDITESHQDDVRAAIERGALVVKGEFVAHVVERKISLRVDGTEVQSDE